MISIGDIWEISHEKTHQSKYNDNSNRNDVLKIKTLDFCGRPCVHGTMYLFHMVFRFEQICLFFFFSILIR